jgi:hypothetical protein
MGDRRVRHRPSPLITARDGLTTKAQLGHGSCLSGESETDPSGDNTDHHEICCSVATNPIYKMSPEFDSDSSREVFMVGLSEPADQTLEEIVRDAEAEIARATCLAREADKVAEKRHRGLQDNS